MPDFGVPKSPAIGHFAVAGLGPAFCGNTLIFRRYRPVQEFVISLLHALIIRLGNLGERSTLVRVVEKR